MFIIKMIAAAALISLASWLSGQYPRLAGFIIALPLTTLIALVFSYQEYQDPEATAAFARSVFVAVPIGLIFLVPFFFQGKWGIGFWQALGLGFAWFIPAYFIHKWFYNSFLS